MKCVRCEMLRVKLRALYMYYVEGVPFDEVAWAIVADTAYSGHYWVNGRSIMRSPSWILFLAGVGTEVVKLNES